MRIIKIFTLLILLSLILAPMSLSLAAPATPPTREELEKQRQEQTKQLETLSHAILTTEATLKDVQGQKNTLQTQVKTLDVSIKQLNLSIQSDEVSTKKVSGEIESLGYDLRDIGLSMDDKNKSLADLFRELQKSSAKNTLMLLLENKTLAEGLAATESIETLRSQVALDIESLKELHLAYQGKIDDLSGKKNELLYHQDNLKNRKQIAEDTKQERATLLTQTKDKESVYQKQLADLKIQQNAISDEIQKIEDQMRATFDPNLLPLKRHGVFAWPVAMKADGGLGIITQHVGEKSYLYRGRAHNGLDIGVPRATPVYAAADGQVIAVDNNDKSTVRKYQYGKYVLIKHDDNFDTLYAHLSNQVVSKGQKVARGQLIGYSGSTGYSTGPHLHFGLYWGPSIQLKSISPAAGLVPIGVTIDPEPYL